MCVVLLSLYNTINSNIIYLIYVLKAMRFKVHVSIMCGNSRRLQKSWVAKILGLNIFLNVLPLEFLYVMYCVYGVCMKTCMKTFSLSTKKRKLVALCLIHARCSIAVCWKNPNCPSMRLWQRNLIKLNRAFYNVDCAKTA